MKLAPLFWKKNKMAQHTFLLTLTAAGLDALVDAQNGVTTAIEITQLGVSAQDVVISPTLTALPGEFKRMSAISGLSVSETVIHMNALDSSDESYDVQSIALYLADGTLFAAYSHSQQIFMKTSIASFLFSVDVAFGEAVSANITFGEADFVFPPASETIKGVAQLATQAEVDAGADAQRIVVPATLHHKLSGLLTPITQSIASEASTRGAADTSLDAALNTIIARTITGAGLAVGGGSLAANRLITVLAASAAQIIAGTESGAAITPAGLGPMIKSLAQNGYCTVPCADPANTLLIQWGRFSAAQKTTTSVSFPITFGSCFSALASGTTQTSTSAQDMGATIRSNSITNSGFIAFSAAGVTEAMCYIAIGKIDLS